MTAAPTKATANPRGGAGTMLMIGSFVLVFLVMFNEGLRLALAGAVGFVFEPTIGFPGEPIWTIFLAGLIMILATTVIRHFLVDWVKLARVQEGMRAFQKEFAEARKSKNNHRIKRLTEAQPEVMQMQMEVQTDQMKPMAVTMLLVIPIFAWLLHFVTDLAQTQVVKVPWNLEWDLLQSWWIMPRWILLYSLFSIPFGTITQKLLKLWEYRKVDLDGDGRPAGESG